jgi:hypothetical protein
VVVVVVVDEVAGDIGVVLVDCSVVVVLVTLSSEPQAASDSVLAMSAKPTTNKRPNFF